MSDNIKQYMGERLTDMLALSYVPRWSILPVSKEQSVGDHTFRVIIIAVEIARRMEGFHALKFPQLYMTALYHDAEESRTADIPRPFNRHVKSAGVKASLGWDIPTTNDPETLYLVSLADAIEAMTWLYKFGLTNHAKGTVTDLQGIIFDMLSANQSPFNREVTRKLSDIVHDIIGAIRIERGR